MAVFSALLLTSPPPGQASEAGGAFVKVDGRETLLRSVELFLNRDNIKQIQLVISPDGIEEAKRKFGAHLGFSGVKLIAGGPRWMDQIAAAGSAISVEASHVIIHDAARPVVPYSDIDSLMTAADKNPAVALAVPVRTTLMEMDEGGVPVAFHLPGNYMHLLTPQAYSKEKFAELVKTKTEIHPSQMTIVKGSSLNIRIGGPADAGMAKTMINMLPKPKMKAPSSPFEEAQW